MATIENPPNSVWPNGLKLDSEGYVTFYPLGTNKIDITTITWPKGDKIISPFVYDENDKLIGFIDTQAFSVPNDNTEVNLSLPGYKHIELELDFKGYVNLEIDLSPNTSYFKLSSKNLYGGIYFSSSHTDSPIPRTMVLDFPNLSSANGMFRNTKLYSLQINMPKLDNCSQMFGGNSFFTIDECPAIDELISCLPQGNGKDIGYFEFMDNDVATTYKNKFAEKGWNMLWTNPY